MIRVWRDGISDIAKNRLFSKIDAGIKETLKGDLKESLPTRGAKDIARTLMSRKVGKNLYISPDGRKYRRVAQDGQEARKGKSRK